MSIVRVRERGQLTIPASFRRQLHLEDDAAVSMILIGQTVVIAPFEAQGEKLAKKFEREMKKKAMSFEDLLKGLKETRRENSRQRYGI